MHIYIYKDSTPPSVPQLPSHLLALRSQVRPAVLVFISIRIFTTIFMLAGYAAKPVKTHPKNIKKLKTKRANKQNTKQTQSKNRKPKKTDDYYTATSHSSQSLLVLCFWLFGFFGCVCCFLFFGFRAMCSL